MQNRKGQFNHKNQPRRKDYKNQKTRYSDEKQNDKINEINKYTALNSFIVPFENTTAKFILDTGANVSAGSKEFCKKTGLNVRCSEISTECKMADGSSKTLSEKTKLPIKTKDRIISYDFMVMSTSDEDFIMGINVLSPI